MKKLLLIFTAAMLINACTGAMDTHHKSNPSSYDQEFIHQLYQELVLTLAQGKIDQRLLSFDFNELLGFCYALNNDENADNNARSTLINWFKTFDHQTKIDLLQHALKHTMIDYAVNFYAMGLHEDPEKRTITQELTPLLYDGITHNKYTPSQLGQIIIMFDENSPIYKTIASAIKEKLHTVEQQGGFQSFLEKQEGFITSDEKDFEIDSAIQMACNNQTIENLNRLQELFLKYQEHPVQGPKLTNAIELLAEITGAVKSEKNSISQDDIFTLNGIKTIKKIVMHSNTLKNMLEDFPENTELEYLFDCTNDQLKTILEIMELSLNKKNQDIRTKLENVQLKDLFVYCTMLHFLDIPSLFEMILNICAERLLSAYKLVEKEELNLLDDKCQELIAHQIKTSYLPVSEFIPVDIYESGFHCPDPYQMTVLDTNHPKMLKPTAYDSLRNILFVINFKEVNLFNLNLPNLSDKRFGTLKPGEEVYGITLSPNGKKLVIRGNKSIFLYDITDLNNIQLISKGHIPFLDIYNETISFITDDQLIIICQRNANLYDLQTQNTTEIKGAPMHNQLIETLNIRKQGTMSKYISVDKNFLNVSNLNVYTITPQGTIDNTNNVIPDVETAFIFDNHALTANNSTISLYDLSDIQPECIKTIDLQTLIPELKNIFSIRAIGATIFTLNRSGRLDQWICKNNKTLEGLQHVAKFPNKVENIFLHQGLLTISTHNPADTTDAWNLKTSVFRYAPINDKQPLIEILQKRFNSPCTDGILKEMNPTDNVLSLENTSLAKDDSSKNHYETALWLSGLAVLSFIGYKLFFNK